MSLYYVGDLNILADTKLTALDKLVYFALVSYMNKDSGKCFPRYETIKKRLGSSAGVRSIQRSCKNLARHKYITIKRLSSSNLYLLTRQLELEKVIKKRVISLSGSSDRSNRRLLIKPYNLTNSRFNRKREFISAPQLEKQFIEHKKEIYKESGREGPWIEYRSDKGKKIRKHSFKNIIEEMEENPRQKKFDAAARKAVALCG
tara:strand:- start:126 stop:734 length:609 start_codon:yes stop_codon:yes gene_type:complete